MTTSYRRRRVSAVGGFTVTGSDYAAGVADTLVELAAAAGGAGAAAEEEEASTEGASEYAATPAAHASAELYTSFKPCGQSGKGIRNFCLLVTNARAPFRSL